jgi:hypothetical protein
MPKQKIWVLVADGAQARILSANRAERRFEPVA